VKEPLFNSLLGLWLVLAVCQTAWADDGKNASEPFSAKYFSHKIALGSTPGESGTFALVIDDKYSAKSARLLIDLDNRFYALPLQISKNIGAFLGKFPTPQNTMKYKIQILLQSGEAFISGSYSVDKTCGEMLLDGLDGKISEDPDSEQLLRKIASLDKEISLLKKLSKELKLPDGQKSGGAG